MSGGGEASAAGGGAGAFSKIAGGFKDGVGVFSNLLGIVKTYDDIKDNTTKRWFDLHEKANISSSVSQEEREDLMRQREDILNKYPKKAEIPEGDMVKLAKIEANLNGNKCEIKEQTKIAIDNIKNVEMRQNVFEDRLNEYG